MASGLIAQSGGKRYHLGQFSYGLGLTASHHFQIRDICEPCLERIAYDTGDSAFLAVRSGSDSFCADRKTGSYPIEVFSVEVGHRQPSGVAGGGLALLSALPDAEVKAILRANAGRLTSYGGLNVQIPHKLIADTRKHGYSVNSDYAIQGVTGVGCAIVDHRGSVLGAISVSNVSRRMNPERRQLVQQILTREITKLCPVLSAGR